MDLIISWISQYGYAAIFCLLMLGIAGLPIPDETVLVFAGYLISQGHLRADAAVAAAFTGSVCGISLSYVIGRTLGLGFVHKYGNYIRVTPARLETVHKWFNRIGHWTLFVGYYIAGVRHFTALVAGASGLEYRSFAVYAYTGAFTWVCMFLVLGYYFGEHWRHIAAVVQHHLAVGSIVLMALVAAYLGYRWYRKRRSED